MNRMILFPICLRERMIYNKLVTMIAEKTRTRKLTGPEIVPVAPMSPDLMLHPLTV